MITGLTLSTPWLIGLATLSGAVALWFVLSRFRTRSRFVLVAFFCVAGGGSAWLSRQHPSSAWLIFLAALLIAILLWIVFHKLGKNLRPSTITWKQYLTGQGALLFFFLLLGSGLAWVSVRYGPYPGRVSKGGQLLKFENLDPSQHPLYQEVDVENYSEISVFTESRMPANGSASVTIYLDHGQAGKLDIGQLESGATAWSRWDQANAGKHLSLVVGPPTQSGAVPATQVDIVVYLGHK